MIEGVETMKDGIVRIIYNKQNQLGVDYIMNNLQDNVFAAFGDTIAKEILGDDFDIVTKLDSELETQHTTKLKSAWHGKQISHTSPPKQPKRIFFGSNKSENLYQPGDSKSYSSITQSTMTQSTMTLSDTQSGGLET